MIKLECTNCKKIWYTANTQANQRCPECLCLLIEKELQCGCYPNNVPSDRVEDENTNNTDQD